MIMSKRRSILIITYEELTSFIGLTTRVKGISTALKRNGWEVYIIAPKYSSKNVLPAWCDGMRVFQIGMCDIVNIVGIPVLRRLVFIFWYNVKIMQQMYSKSIECDFIQSEQAYSLLSAYFLAKKFKAKVILDDPTMLKTLVDMRINTKSVLNRIMKVMSGLYEKMTIILSDFIICSSQKTKEYFFKQDGENEDKFYCLPNAVDKAEYAFLDKSRFGCSIFFNCSLPFYQNDAALRNLMNILNKLSRQNIKYKLNLLVNNIDNIPTDVMGSIKQNDKITLKEKVESIVPFIQGSDFTLLPYEKGHFLTAGARLKALEALAAGSVVVTTPEGIDGIDECKDTENVMICENVDEMADMVINVFTNLVLYERMLFEIRKNARRMIEEKYAWDKVVETYERL